MTGLQTAEGRRDMSEPTEYPQVRAPKDEFKLVGQSLFEIWEGMKNEETRLTRRVRLQGRKVKMGPLLSLYCLWCLTRPPEERERIAREMATLYERLQSLAEPGDIAEVYASIVKEMMTNGPVKNLPGIGSWKQTLGKPSVANVERLQGNDKAGVRKPKKPPVRK